MKIHNIIILFSLTASILAFANATEDLLSAIENGNVKEVEKALAQGADLDTTRSGDNHSARSLVLAKLLEVAESEKTIVWAGRTALILPAMALYQKPTCALAAIGAILAGVLLTKNDSNNVVQTLKSLRIDQLLAASGGLGIVALAWKSPENWQILVNTLGTIGLITFLYKSYQVLKCLHMYGLINPHEYQLTSENVQD